MVLRADLLEETIHGKHGETPKEVMIIFDGYFQTVGDKQAAATLTLAHIQKDQTSQLRGTLECELDDFTFALKELLTTTEPIEGHRND